MPNYTTPSIAELADIAEQELQAGLDPHGTGRVDLHDGSRNTALVSMEVGLAARVVRYAADREAAARPSTAKGDDLDIAGRDLFDEPRKGEAFATGFRRLLRGASRPATTIPKGSRFAVPASGSSPAVMFQASATVQVLTNDTVVDVPVIAVDSGTAGNLTDPALLSQIVDPLPDTAWATTTPAAGTVFGGGDTAESDEVYSARLGRLSSEESSGTEGAILAAVLRVPGVRYATVVEPLNGTLVAFVGDPGLALTPVLRTSIATELLGARCFGVPVDLRPFTLVDVPVVAAVNMSRSLDNYDTAAIITAMDAAVVAYFEGRVRTDEYFVEMIEAAVASSYPEVQSVSLSAPASSVPRPHDSTYASASTINHYRVLPGAARFTLAPPLTT